jgi:hypothetical protein
VAVSGNYAYIADSFTGLRIIDISNPAAPGETGFFDTGDNARSVDVSGNYVYLADGADGLYIIQNDLLTGIDNQVSPVVKNFSLQQNYPNPFNPSTIINYQLSMTSDVELSIYNLLGQKVAVLVSEKQTAGRHLVEWNASGFPSGIYYYQLEAGDYREIKKMILLR